jgi:hypothetical protein
MLHSIIGAVLKHKQLIIIAAAVTGLIGYALPLNQVAQAQSLAQDIVSRVLGTTGIDNNDEDEEDTTDQSIEQPIDQTNNQEIDQSETNDQSNTNTQTQASSVDQDIAQGIRDGDDSTRSSSESGDAKKHSSSSSESGDAVNANDQEATNNAHVSQQQHQTVTQDNDVEFGDDSAEQNAANIAVPIADPTDIDEDYGHRLLQDDNDDD